MSLIPNCSSFSVYRDGVLINSYATKTPYIDPMILTGNTSYIYSFIPYDSSGVPGLTQNITIATLSDITWVIIYSKSLTDIVLQYAGNYTNVSITRNGISIATHITGTTYTDTGLTPNTSYTYIVTPFGKNNYTTNNDQVGVTFTIITITIPNLESIYISFLSTTQIVLEYTGKYTNVSILRNGISIATNVTGTTFTDTGLTVNTSYTYIVTPYNSLGDAGVIESITQSTLPNITSISIIGLTTTQIVLGFSGNYTSVSIYRNGTYIANISGTTYTDSGLTVNTSYTYIVTPYNTNVNAGTVAIITRSTIPVLTTVNISSKTSTQIVLLFTGNYTNVSITRNGTSIATNITGLSYTDSGLTPNTSYTYIVTPYNSSGDSGTTGTITQSTLPNITSFSIPSETTTEFVFLFIGNYTNVNLTRDGITIASHITGTTYTDTGLIVNTSYTYIITPFGITGDVGVTSTITHSTLPILTSFSISSKTTTQIVLLFTGNYTNVNLTRNGISIVNTTGTTYTDTGLIPNTSYIYIVTPIGVSGSTNTAGTLTQITLPNLISLSISSYTTTEIVLLFTGNYTNVSIYRDGISIATNKTGSTYTDSGLTVNTSYTYIVTPYNSSGDTNTALTITHSTLSLISSVGISSKTTTQIVLLLTGIYTNVHIYRNGTYIANITGMTFTDTGLSSNTSYTYIITPYNLDGYAGTTGTITQITLPFLTSVSISSGTDTQIVLLFVGNYANVSITRNGNIIATNVTGTTYTDTGLTGNTTYTYIVTPYNSSGDTNTTATTTQKSLPNITSVSIPSKTTTQIVLVYAGNYTNVSITRDGILIATHITGTTFTDTGLTVNTSYTYIVTSYNSSGDAGTTATIAQITLPNLTSLSVSSQTTSQIVLVYAGNYTNVSITRNGTSIATNVSGTTFTDTGLTANTSYTYIVTPYNSTGDIGATATITKQTLPDLTSLSISSVTISQIVLVYAGNYANVSITEMERQLQPI